MLRSFFSSALRNTQRQRDDAKPTMPNPTPADVPQSTPRDHAARFAYEMLEPADYDIPAQKLLGAYRRWCENNELIPFSGLEFGTALLDLLIKSGIETAEIKGRPHILGTRVRYFPAPMPKRQNKISVQRNN